MDEEKHVDSTLLSLSNLFFLVVIERHNEHKEVQTLNIHNVYCYKYRIAKRTKYYTCQDENSVKEYSLINIQQNCVVEIFFVYLFDRDNANMITSRYNYTTILLIIMIIKMIIIIITTSCYLLESPNYYLHCKCLNII